VAGGVRRGADDKPCHSVICGENYHALQLLAYTHAGKVDVIYIDPPYNTGDKSWKYNNRFVDSNDSYRHSKWLAMMERRLKLAKKLLKPTGVLIVTIDEHEVHHLGVLLEMLFPSSARQMVVIVNNAAGNTRGAFSRVEEYALFCLPDKCELDKLSNDLLSDEDKTNVRAASSFWTGLVRSGGINDLPSKRPNLVFPIGVNPQTNRVVGCGPSLKERLVAVQAEMTDADSWRPNPDETVEGCPVVWPYSRDGSLGVWRNKAETTMKLARDGFLRVSPNPGAPGTNEYSLSFINPGHRRKITDGEIPSRGREPNEGPVILGDTRQETTAKTVWRRKAHNATQYGSPMLKSLIGSTRFKYPKSLYAVADTLATLITSKPEALVLDFFAGSGTTLHAVALLNAQDGGRRQCILVTNNELGEAEAKALNKRAHFRGDPEFEERGIFESVTMPRVKAAITGTRPDGQPVEGSYLASYLPDHDYADGFEENVAFFRMGYLGPGRVGLGRQYEAIAPLLWMAAGSVGEWEPWDGASPWSAPEASSYAVLFDESKMTDLVACVAARNSEQEDGLQRISHVWIVTDSHSAFVELRASLPEDVVVGQLYREYLRNFAVNGPGSDL